VALTLRLTPELQAQLHKAHRDGTKLQLRVENDPKGGVKVGVRGKDVYQIARGSRGR
jgi:hypothetical protein